MSKKYNTSVLENIIQQAWSENDLNKAKQIVKDYLSETKIASKESMITTLDTITTKKKLDFYLANSLLAFEGMRTQIENKK